jgi:monoamine oxidase
MILCPENPGFSPRRRRFVTTTTLGAVAAGTLSACGSFDRWVTGDSNHLDEEVMILGGGLAGLAAAYHLKKNKTRYRLFEGSERLGGRVQSLRHFNADDQVAEMGAEFFEGSHKAVHELCKDLNIRALDVSYNSKSDRAVYWIKGKAVSEKDFKKLLRPIALKLAQARQEIFASIPTEISPRTLLSFARAPALDEHSLSDLLTSLKTSNNEDVVSAFETLCVSEWGVESKEINLLQFLGRLDFEARALAGGTATLHRVDGGASRLVDVLGERVQGIVPDSVLKVDHRLVAIRGRSGGFDCTFKTPKGSDTIWARQVICTLPWSLLKEVDGIQSLDLSVEAKDLISKAQYASHAKVVSSFRDPFWKKKTLPTGKNQGVFRGDLLGQNYWDSGRGQPGSRSLMTSQRGGLKGQSTGSAAPAESLKDLRNFHRELGIEESSQVTNWSQKPFSRGSRLNLGPGRYLKYLKFLGEESASTFYFAGEHISFKDFGTMNGALETAIESANKALQKVYLKSFL